MVRALHEAYAKKKSLNYQNHAPPRDVTIVKMKTLGCPKDRCFPKAIIQSVKDLTLTQTVKP